MNVGQIMKVNLQSHSCKAYERQRKLCRDDREETAKHHLCDVCVCECEKDLECRQILVASRDH